MALQRVQEWTQAQQEAYRNGDERPLAGYLRAMVVYGAACAGAAAVAVRTGRRGPDRITPWDVALLGMATHKLSRTLTKDAVTSPLRMPFVRYQQPSGEGEIAEEVRSHGGTKHAVGELLTCPFCIAQWVASAFVAGSVFAPAATRVVSTTFAGVAVSDTLQLAYAALQRLAEGD